MTAIVKQSIMFNKKEDPYMSRPINICSGQFGDLPLEELCRIMHGIGYNGIEIATQSHLDVRR